MDDLISRQKILDFCNQVINRDVAGDDTNIVVEAFKAFKAYVDAISSAQPEIIRCKDCKNCETTGNYNYCKVWRRETSIDGYCYKGDAND